MKTTKNFFEKNAMELKNGVWNVGKNDKKEIYQIFLIIIL